ncbi:MAG: helix-turn-helix transcriptional regulator [Desulfobacterium sp.]|nr:helix-turn-helix transcriptional regulator [Desulfobacterium sp.]
MHKLLAELIRFHRKKSGLTQVELSEMADVGKNMVHGIETGILSVGFDNLLKILHVLNIEIEFTSPLMESFFREREDAKG